AHHCQDDALVHRTSPTVVTRQRCRPLQMWDCDAEVWLTAEGAIGATPAGCFASEGVISTRATPFLVIPSFCAARLDKSNVRPRTCGPRSLIRTSTERPFSGLVTTTREPSGRVFDAAVMAFWLKRSPVVVRRPLNPGPYHEASSCRGLGAGRGAVRTCG